MRLIKWCTVISNQIFITFGMTPGSLYVFEQPERFDKSDKGRCIKKQIYMEDNCCFHCCTLLFSSFFSECAIFLAVKVILSEARVRTVVEP